MTKLEFTLSASTLECLITDEKTATTFDVAAGARLPLSRLVDDTKEIETFQSQLDSLLLERQNDTSSCPFRTFNLVFSAPEAPTSAPPANREKIAGVFSSPIGAIHVSDEVHISCFASIELDADGETVYATALEYSRSHREKLLRKEFGSWLLETHIEKAVIATTMMGEVVFWNRFASELYQYSAEEAVGKSIMKLTPSEMTMEQAGEIMGQLQQGKHWTGMFRVQRKDQSNFMAHVTDTPVVDENGELKFIVGISYDYTGLYNTTQELEVLTTNLENEIKIRTEKLLEKENDLRMVGTAVQQSDNAVLITDSNFHIVWHNDAVLTLLNPDNYCIRGTSPWDLPLKLENPKADAPYCTFKEVLEAVRDDQIERTTVCSTMACSGTDSPSPKVFNVKVELLDSKGKRGAQRMITLRDLTTQRMANELRIAAEKAAATSETKTLMMQTLSHELRTPLQGIMGVTSTWLVDMDRDNVMYDSLSTILASSRLLLTLINNVLDTRKVDSKMMTSVEVAPVPTMACLIESLKYCEPFATLNEIKLVLSSDSELERNSWNFISNRLRMVQVLINLISNAIKYTTSGTDVVLSVRKCSAEDANREARNAVCCAGRVLKAVSPAQQRHEEVTIISVRDHGRGVPPEESHKLFAEFVQLSVSEEKDSSYKGGKATSAGQSSGSGLGLHLAMQLMGRMNGRIWVDNCDPSMEDQRGAVFSICLPTAPSSTEKEPRESESPTEEVTTMPGKLFDDLSVMVVDDSLINVKVLKCMLRRLGVNTIISFLNATEALDYLVKTNDKGGHVPELILSDLNMPGMDGYEFARNIRKYDFEPRPKVMSCSADWMPETEKKCLRVGFDGMIRKPLTFSELRDHLLKLRST
jgi:PAS domain S-box-containing protein